MKVSGGKEFCECLGDRGTASSGLAGSRPTAAFQTETEPQKTPGKNLKRILDCSKSVLMGHEPGLSQSS